MAVGIDIAFGILRDAALRARPSGWGLRFRASYGAKRGAGALFGWGAPGFRLRAIQAGPCVDISHGGGARKLL